MAGELIGREALERIIQRAAELQTGERDIGEGLTEPELLALGQDVGIPARYLRQALLEERIRGAVPQPGGLWAWLAGPSGVPTGRVVPGDRSTVERALEHWLQEEELLQMKRRFPDRTTWEPKVGAFASIQRALRARGRVYALAHADEVAGQVTPLESGHCYVQLLAEVRSQRHNRLVGAACTLGAGIVMVAAAAPLNWLAPALYVTASVVVLVAFSILRRHRAENAKIQVALDQVLDRLEHGEIRPDQRLPGPQASPLARIAEELRRTFDI